MVLFSTNQNLRKASDLFKLSQLFCPNFLRKISESDKFDRKVTCQISLSRNQKRMWQWKKSGCIFNQEKCFLIQQRLLLSYKSSYDYRYIKDTISIWKIRFKTSIWHNNTLIIRNHTQIYHVISYNTIESYEFRIA